MEISKNSVKSAILEMINRENFKKIIIFVGLLGIFLIFISNFFKTSSKTDISEKHVKQTDYAEQMQMRLQKIVAGIAGAGQAEVLVTLESGSETIYAKEEKNNKQTTEDNGEGESTRKKESDDTEVKYIKVKESDGTERALALKQVEPTVKGVVIVCPGGNEKMVRKKIIDVVKTALNISEKRVCVTN
jgi:stage III sporulation protein AG